MADLTDRVQSVLGDAYRVERELSPGGMSRLFLATERSLDRRVVIKVLPPELASEVSAARFQLDHEFALEIFPDASYTAHEEIEAWRLFQPSQSAAHFIVLNTGIERPK